MPLKLDGTYGVSGIDGTASTPSLRGSDLTGNGIVYGTDTVQIATGGTTAVTVDSSQNVGIGTASPSAKLHVVGNSYITGSTGTGGVIYLSSDNYKAISCSPSTGDYLAFIQNPYASGIQFGYSAIGSASTFNPKMTLDSSGNLLVGTTSVPSGGGKITVSGDNAAGRMMQLIGTVAGDAANFSMTIAKFANDSTTNQRFIGFVINNGASGSGQINANGASACAFGSFSDERLKENIVELPNQLANICALKPSEFDFKDGSGHQIGFIAQEMQDVYPDVVGEGDDGMLTITGWSKTEARLVKAIQELSAKLDAAEARIAALEAK